MVAKIMHKKPTQNSQISLFLKSYIIKASYIFIFILLIASTPSQANAGFFDFIIGTSTQASEADTSTASSSNSQNVPVLDTSSIDPDVKNVTSNSDVNIVDGGALMADDTSGTDAGTNSYVSSSDSITTYTVKEGDTLGKIASKFGISKNTILYANTDIKSTLKVGQVLIILPVDGVSYTVKKGDTIESVAKAYKADPTDIAEFNDISSTKGLKAGQVIIVPGGVLAKKPEAPKKIAEKSSSKIQSNDTSSIQIADKSDNKVEKTQASPEDISSGNGILNDYIWPLPKGTGRVSQRLHDDNAYDFAAPRGTPIYAIADGTVLIADGSGYNGGYGLYVVINFNDGGQAIFGHMSKVAAEAGETVKQGDIIGYVGSTGRSTGNHVHIGYRGGKPNPYHNLPLNSNGL